MLSPLFIAYLAALSQGAAPPPTAAGLVSRMLARYASAKSLTGSVRTTQVAGTASVVTETSLAYERPSRIRLAQHQKSTLIDRSRFLVSNGDWFAYSPPDRLMSAAPLVERVRPEKGQAQTVGELYSVIAGDLPDRSPVLDVLVARKDDMTYFANQLARFSLAPKETIAGTQANVVEGDWRESDTVDVSGRFKLYISDEGDLLRYVLTQKFAAPAGNSARGNPVAGDSLITVVTTWDTKIELNAPVKSDTFALRTP